MGTGNKSLALLVGNGLSIAFNEELRLEKITSEVISRLDSLGKPGTPVVHALQNIARSVANRTGNPESNFEDLVGAFEAENLNIDLLKELAEIVSPEDSQLSESFDRVIEFTQGIQSAGLSHVLEVIMDKSHGSQDQTTELVHFINTVIDHFQGVITIGNLNYDTLMLAGLMALQRQDFADMGHGYNSHTVHLSNGQRLDANLLRESSDFPDSKRIRLLHLHGSLTFWEERSTGKLLKLKKEQVIAASLLTLLREPAPEMRPLVVLSSAITKPGKITSAPFSLAYEIFANSLQQSDFWLIVGYSFRDESINKLLKEKFMHSQTRLLVVTLGEKPTMEQIAKALDISLVDLVAQIFVYREGAASMLESPEWESFSAYIPSS